MPVTRSALRKVGRATRERLGQPAAPAGRSVPGYGDWADEVIYGGIWSRPGLALPDRMVCTLAALSLLQRLDALKTMVGTALDIGLPPRAIVEVFMQAGLYGGFPTTEAAAACASDVFAARSVRVVDEPERNDTKEALDARGQELMARMHGERGQQGYAAPGNAVTGALYPSAVRYGYGELWFRPGLVHRQRMLVAVASFTVLGLDAQLRKFAQSAVNMGLPRNEIIEAVIQTAPYGGFPRALNGLAILSEVLPTDA
jgi:alkylhydroperoxidase/carboxymuconolactone decarboxylase family protein YurZ